MHANYLKFQSDRDVSTRALSQQVSVKSILRYNQCQKQAVVAGSPYICSSLPMIPSLSWIQEAGMIASEKHFIGNEQEYGRNRLDSN
ncbi:hypothetical protein SS1G_14131 [Sclerotinia sclerotiorum 1980 UF-70]|uniref:Uncharacterized protein n=1 Tax=Sclerotinia sclerotiorum (strain ATCC 18683 / 1980 / Ss-1) TaxID=665079 RepID=A7F950_SCLS1|nr:hypothetical protein SS1G_14131 [Sclerotinia sclerotiorum 1980 UF-70]EDO00261.1 hypothetical protein SS1G_14131 [Sclerotinia sclerotiorum 1980 UF-70]